MTRRRAASAWIAPLFGALAIAAPAAAQGEPLSPYAGKVPYKCELQDAGSGPGGADTTVDPYCVEFDKSDQNVTDFGLVDFLAQEPPRFGTAGAKCFYFQRDHWTGSIEQGSEPTLWHWDGNYFFNKANATGGVSVADFAVGGAPMDASPYAPPEYAAYFAEGGGGNLFIAADTPADPQCAERVDTGRERHRTYKRWYRRALRDAGF